MSGFFRRSMVMMSTCLLGGCAADAVRHEHDEHASVESGEPTSQRMAEPGMRCGGAALPACDGPFTGATCDLPCFVTHGEAAATCGLDVYCHSDGAVYGLATRNAVLYRGEPDDDESNVESAFRQWIVGHAADLGLEAGLEPENLELHRIEGSRSAAGPLTIFRFSQTYDGLPVLAPDGLVTLVYGPQGAVSVTGAIVDNRVRYEYRARQASQAKAESSMLAHASTQEGVPVEELEVVHATRVAMSMARAIGWVGFVRRKGEGAMRARVIVDADPVFSGAVLPLRSYRELVMSGLEDTQPIQVRALDPAGEPETLAYDIETMLTTGAPLLGSVDDVSSEIQLADERVVMLDMHGAPLDDLLHLQATRILDPAGAFLTNSGPELSAQVAYYLFQSWYDLIDGHLTDPAAGAKRWDSANLLYSNGMTPSDTPRGTFTPKVLAFSNVSSNECPVDGAACMNRSGYPAGYEPVLTFPELAHVPTGASNQETTGSIMLPGDGIEPVTFAHEFGHVIDLFTGGGITWGFAPDCNGACSLECIEDTTDEAPPLTESIAQLLAFVFLRHSFEGVGFDHCAIVPLVSRNGTNPWTPGACIPPGEDISLFERSDTCTKPTGYCDKPETAGFRRPCCFDDEDLTECTIEIPDECPVGATNSNGGMGTGTARVEPTGLCDYHPGYRTNSLYQAFWQLLNGQRCEATAPFACVSAAWPAGVDPMEATTAALLYAMRINALTYDELFDGMATYVSCTYGAAAYDEFNAVACNHGIRDCEEPAPMICEDCGNGVREGSETCDGHDWLLISCEDDPLYAGGALSCDQNTCQLDHSQCTMPGLDTTAATMSPEHPSMSTSAETYAETETYAAGAGGTDSGGCGCRAPASIPGGLLVLSLSMLGAMRRRRVA